MCTVQVDRADSYFLCGFCIQYYEAVAPVVQRVTSKPYCTDTEVVGSILGEFTRTVFFFSQNASEVLSKQNST